MYCCEECCVLIMCFVCGKSAFLGDICCFNAVKVYGIPVVLMGFCVKCEAIVTVMAVDVGGGAFFCCGLLTYLCLCSLWRSIIYVSQVMVIHASAAGPGPTVLVRTGT